MFRCIAAHASPPSFLQTPPEQPQADSTYPHQQGGLRQGDDHSPEDIINPAGPSGPRATQARLLPQHLEPTAPRCPSQHTRRRPKSPSQAMPQRKDIAVLYSQYGTVVLLQGIHRPSHKHYQCLRECGSEGWLYGNKVFLIGTAVVRTGGRDPAGFLSR